ncbi:MAG: RidA family protein [Oscillospiraceae bacterium]|nr:RidA family protein [Oscillospiraceae bacterium]
MKKIITTQDAPAAIGPYSQAVQAGNLVYTSGQIPLDPKTGKLVEGGIEAETWQVFANLKAVLNAAGVDFSNVVKTMVFLTDLANFATVNAIYAEYFPENPPARACIQAAALPAGAQVEIEAIALVD